MITLLKCEVGKEIKVIEMDLSLKAMKEEVGGYIEQFKPYKDDAVLIVNEEGKLLNLPLNRAIYDEQSGELIDVIAGDFLIVYAPRDGDEYQTLPPKLLEKYSEKFKYPDEFYRRGDKLIAFPMKEKNNDRQERDAR